MRQSLTVIVVIRAPVAARARLRAAVGADFRQSVQDAPRERDLGRHRLRAHPLVHALPPSHGRRRGFEAVAKYVEQKAREYGLEDVRVIRQKTSTHELVADSWASSDADRAVRAAPGVHS